MGPLDLSNPPSIKQFLKARRHLNLIGSRKPNQRHIWKALNSHPISIQIELGPVGRRGAAAALARLEEIEERAHARLMRAIEAGNRFQIKAAQEFTLDRGETLRRLDLAVETER